MHCRLREILRAKQYSHRELAAHLGCTREQVSWYCAVFRGMAPRLGMALRIARFLDTPIEHIWSVDGTWPEEIYTRPGWASRTDPTPASRFRDGS